MCALRFSAVSRDIVMRCWVLISICSAIASCHREWIIRWNCGVWINRQSARPSRRATHSMRWKVSDHSVRWMNTFRTIRRVTFIETMSIASNGWAILFYPKWVWWCALCVESEWILIFLFLADSLAKIQLYAGSRADWTITMSSSTAIRPHLYCIASSTKTAKFGSFDLPWTFTASTWRLASRVVKRSCGNWTHRILHWRASPYCRIQNARQPFGKQHSRATAIF